MNLFGKKNTSNIVQIIKLNTFYYIICLKSDSSSWNKNIEKIKRVYQIKYLSTIIEIMQEFGIDKVANGTYYEHII